MVYADNDDNTESGMSEYITLVGDIVNGVVEERETVTGEVIHSR